jgi:hypothetical protein
MVLPHVVCEYIPLLLAGVAMATSAKTGDSSESESEIFLGWAYIHFGIWNMANYYLHVD